MDSSIGLGKTSKSTPLSILGMLYFSCQKSLVGSLVSLNVSFFRLPSNGFAYGCTICDFYVDINCAFIPKEITHARHHLLSIVKPSEEQSVKSCKACKYGTYRNLVFYCPCDFYIHVECALLLSRVFMHKFDKHPLSLRYH
ncbi:hypothetical protein M8C21_026287, partial [Ambrosia artemisiifolia]